jgi:lipoyl(octanoyl) transferase
MAARAPKSPPMTAIPDTIEWRAERSLIPYPEALAEMEARAAAIAAGDARELIWLLEHPPIYTAGTSADPVELVDPRFPVHQTGRGGRYTYHGPGQRIGYAVLNLRTRRKDVRNYVHAIEAWVIATLARFDIHAFAVPERVGIWTRDGGVEAKIGAIGVRVRQWVTLHGFSVNLSPDLGHFSGIVPCGIAEYPVTSAELLGKHIDSETFDAALALEVPSFLAMLESQ